jgi:hypothetical protein
MAALFTYLSTVRTGRGARARLAKRPRLSRALGYSWVKRGDRSERARLLRRQQIARAKRYLRDLARDRAKKSPQGTKIQCASATN